MSLLTIVLVFSVAFGAAYTSECPRECPTYWTSYGCFCYRLFGSPQTWHHAEGRCQYSYPGRTPHLASIHSYGENTYLKRLMETAHGERFNHWIGLSEVWRPGHYGWSDHSVKNYLDWQPGEPNNHEGAPEHCVEVWNWGWNDKSCYAKRSYVCKMPK